MFKYIENTFYYLVHIKKDPSLTMYYKHLGVNIGQNCSFIGKNINVGSEPYLITIGNNVRISFDVAFVTHDGGTHILRLERPDAVIYGPITIGNNVFIGARSIIMPNVKIGNNCVIGAGSIVTKNISDNTIVAGVPAKKICSVCEYKNKHNEEILDILHMPYNEKKYFLSNRFRIKN